MNIDIEKLSWDNGKSSICPIRRTVFIEEQQVSEAEEWDEFDENSSTIHLVAQTGHQTIGTARICNNGQIGRIAVLKEYRHNKVATKLLKFSIAEALKKNFPNIFLHAQVYLTGFYKRYGFTCEGDVFEEAGIDHQKMCLVQDPALLASLMNDQVIRVDNPDDFIFYFNDMLATSSHSINVLSNSLPESIYGAASIVQSISDFARTNRHTLVRILVQDTNKISSHTHELIRLIQRLPSHMEIRKLTESPEKDKAGFTIIDKRKLVYFNEEDSLNGFVNYNAPAECRHSLDEFDMLWSHYSVEDQNLRTFYL